VTIEQSEMRSPWLAQLRAAIVRFVVKLAFFSGIVTLGGLGAYWLPDPNTLSCDLDTSPLFCGAVVGAAFCILNAILFGMSGLAVTVFTAGHKPRWD
jgi:hypothetical protein